MTCIRISARFKSTAAASWYSSVGRVIGLRNGQTGANSRQKKEILLLSKAQSGSETHTSSTYSVGTEAVSSGVRWPVRKVCHLPPSSTDVRNECNYTSTPSIRLHGDKQTFVWLPVNSGTALKRSTKHRDWGGTTVPLQSWCSQLT
jgi:hypothetical protein